MTKDRKIKREKRSETRWRGRAKGSEREYRPMYALWWGGLEKLCTSDITGIRRLLTLGRIAIRFDDAWIAALAVAACSRRVVFLSIDDYIVFSCLLLLPPFSDPIVSPLRFFFPLQSGERRESDEIIRKYTHSFPPTRRPKELGSFNWKSSLLLEDIQPNGD